MTRAGDPAEEGEGVGVAGQEVLHGLGDGELDVQHPAVAEHHHEEAQPAAGVAHADRAELAPVHLGTFAGGEGERQEGRRARRADLVDVVLDDGDPAGVAGLAQPQEDLRGGVGVALQPADDLLLDRDPACWAAAAACRGWNLSAASQRATVRSSRCSSRAIWAIVRWRLSWQVLDLAVQFVVDHG